MSDDMDVPKAEVIRHGGLGIQVCVPSAWSDEKVLAFAEDHCPCGTENGWQIRRDDVLMEPYPERNPCEDRVGFVHIMLDA